MNIHQRAALCLVVLAAPLPAVAGDPSPARDLELLKTRFGVSQCSLADVRVVAPVADHTLLQTELAGQPVTLFVGPWSLRSTDFEVLVQGGDGALRSAVPPPLRTVRGTVLEWEGSRVVGTLRDGRLRASVQRNQKGTWCIEPIPTDISPERPDLHVVFQASDLTHEHIGTCGVNEHDELDALDAAVYDPVHQASTTDHPDAPGDDQGGFPRRGGPKAAEISIDSDVEYYVYNNSSVDQTVDDIEELMVSVDNLYRQQAGISYIVNRIIVRTAEPDPYDTDSPSGLRDQLRDEWETNLGHLERAIVHLMTGRELGGTQGGTLGIAFINEVCTRHNPEKFDEGSYGLSESHFGPTASLVARTALTAHELGHNWSARHCSDECTEWTADCGFMCEQIFCCENYTHFDAENLASVIDYRDSRHCLHPWSSQTWVRADASGPEDGTFIFPFNTFREGVWATDPGGRVIFFGGQYNADRTLRILNRPLRLEAQSSTGVVRIGP